MFPVPIPLAEGAPVSEAGAPPGDEPRRGDTLERVYRRYAAAVFRFAFRCVGRRDLAEDLTSEAFLALQQKLDEVDLAQLPSWLFKVVKNRAIDHWRRQQTERRYLEALPDEQSAAAPSAGLKLLDDPALKPVHRACLLLRYVHGMSRPEIAARTGLNENQVKGHLQYGLELLRRTAGERVQ